MRWEEARIGFPGWFNNLYTLIVTDILQHTSSFGLISALVKTQAQTAVYFARAEQLIDRTRHTRQSGIEHVCTVNKHELWQALQKVKDRSWGSSCIQLDGMSWNEVAISQCHVMSLYLVCVCVSA